MTSPVLFMWTDEGVMRPASALWARRADKTFTVGEQYPLVVNEERSMSQHRRYFATLNEGFSNLPEEYADRWPSAEHMRKWLLIRAGYHTTRDHVCETEEEAQRLAAFIKPVDEYAVVVARGTVVRIYTAKSQSVRSMGKADFKDSQEKVLNLLDDILGVSRGETMANAGRAA